MPISKTKSCRIMIFANYAIGSILALTSFNASASPLHDAAVNPDRRNISIFKVLGKNEDLTKIRKKCFANGLKSVS